MDRRTHEPTDHLMRGQVDEMCQEGLHLLCEVSEVKTDRETQTDEPYDMHIQKTVKEACGSF